MPKPPSITLVAAMNTPPNSYHATSLIEYTSCNVTSRQSYASLPRIVDIELLTLSLLVSEFSQRLRAHYDYAEPSKTFGSRHAIDTRHHRSLSPPCRDMPLLRILPQMPRHTIISATLDNREECHHVTYATMPPQYGRHTSVYARVMSRHRREDAMVEAMAILPVSQSRMAGRLRRRASPPLVAGARATASAPRRRPLIYAAASAATRLLMKA